MTYLEWQICGISLALNAYSAADYENDLVLVRP